MHDGTEICAVGRVRYTLSLHADCDSCELAMHLAIAHILGPYN